MSKEKPVKRRLIDDLNKTVDDSSKQKKSRSSDQDGQGSKCEKLKQIRARVGNQQSKPPKNGRNIESKDTRVCNKRTIQVQKRTLIEKSGKNNKCSAQHKWEN